MGERGGTEGEGFRFADFPWCGLSGVGGDGDRVTEDAC